MGLRDSLREMADLAQMSQAEQAGIIAREVNAQIAALKELEREGDESVSGLLEQGYEMRGLLGRIGRGEPTDEKASKVFRQALAWQKEAAKIVPGARVTPAASVAGSALDGDGDDHTEPEGSDEPDPGSGALRVRAWDEWIEDESLTDTVKSHSAATVEALERFFAQDDWQFTTHADEGAIETGVEADNASFDCWANVCGDAFEFIVVAPDRVTGDRLADVGEFVARTNVDAGIGKFVVDFDSGRLVYSVSTILKGLGHDDRIAVASELVDYAVAALDDCYPHIRGLLDGSSSAEDAAESAQDEFGRLFVKFFVSPDQPDD